MSYVRMSDHTTGDHRRSSTVCRVQTSSEPMLAAVSPQQPSAATMWATSETAHDRDPAKEGASQPTSRRQLRAMQAFLGCTGAAQ